MNSVRFAPFVLAALAAGLPSIAAASSHREAPAISMDPAADNTDLYAWVTPGTRDKLHIVANWIPLEEPSGGPNFHMFSDDVRYEIHIARGKDLNDVATYFIKFDTSKPVYQDPSDLGAGLINGKEFFIQLTGVKQTYELSRLDRKSNKPVVLATGEVAPPNIGPRTAQVAYGKPYDDAYAASFIKNTSEGGRVWAGPRDDGFYVDLGGVFDLANLRAAGTAQDGVSGFNTHSISLEIPVSKLGLGSGADAILGVWASSSRRKIQIQHFSGKDFDYGPWVQVSRLGIPLVNEVVIGYQDKDKFNATHPSQDVKNFGGYVLNPVIVRDAEAVGIYMTLGVDPKPFKSGRTDILTALTLGDVVPFGDMLRIDTTKDSAFPNGRPIPGGLEANMEQADVTDVLMTVILAKGMVALGDGVNYNDDPFLAQMPWLPLPHSGYDGGHGKPTP